MLPVREKRVNEVKLFQMTIFTLFPFSFSHTHTHSLTCTYTANFQDSDTFKSGNASFTYDDFIATVMSI